MTVSNAVAGFLPSVHGLHFANRFESGPTVKLGFIDPRMVGVGDASAGLCGGMSVFVQERFAAGQPIPADVVAPANGSPLFQMLVRRQVQSLDWLRGPMRFWFMGLRGGDWARTRSLTVEWPRIRATIDQGRLALVGLVRHEGWNPWNLTESHTVVAFGYSIADPGPDGSPGRHHAPPVRPELAGSGRRLAQPRADRAVAIDGRGAVRGPVARLIRCRRVPAPRRRAGASLTGRAASASTVRSQASLIESPRAILVSRMIRTRSEPDRSLAGYRSSRTSSCA